MSLFEFGGKGKMNEAKSQHQEKFYFNYLVKIIQRKSKNYLICLFTVAKVYLPVIKYD